MVGFEKIGRGIIPDIRGLEIGYDTATTLSVDGGVCLDDTQSQVVALGQTFVKDVALVWAAGSGNGGSVSSSGTPFSTNPGDTIHTWIIKNPVTGQVDVCVSNTLTPDLPTGYTLKRRVGSIVFSGAATIPNFIKRGNFIEYDSSVWQLDYDGNQNSVASTAYTLLVPKGFSVKAKYHITCKETATTNPVLFIAGNDLSPIAGIPNDNIYRTNGLGGFSGDVYFTNEAFTDNQGRIQIALITAPTFISIVTTGFWDYR